MIQRVVDIEVGSCAFLNDFVHPYPGFRGDLEGERSNGEKKSPLVESVGKPR